MNKTPESPVNDEMETWEMRVQQEARQFVYPPTPDIARQVRSRLRTKPRPVAFRLARAAALLVTILGVLLAVPQTRALMLEIIRIGAVRLLPYLPSPTPTEAPTETPNPQATASRTPRPTLTPMPTPLTSVLDLPGETTFDEAQKQVRFTILLPTYPEGIGQPDRVFLQKLPVPVVTMVWLEAPGSDQVRLVMAVIGQNGFVGKFYPWNETLVKVNGQDAIWLTEPHELYQELPGRNEMALERRMVQDYALIWVASDRLTYRLETNLPLEEALKVAESVGKSG